MGLSAEQYSDTKVFFQLQLSGGQREEMKTGAAAGTDCGAGARARPWARAGGQAGDKRLKSPHCWRSIRPLYPHGDCGQFLAIMMNVFPMKTAWIQPCFKNIVCNSRTTSGLWPQSRGACFSVFPTVQTLISLRCLNTKSPG